MKSSARLAIHLSVFCICSLQQGLWPLLYGSGFLSSAAGRTVPMLPMSVDALACLNLAIVCGILWSLMTG